jgi:CRP-like cAMP-binding protein
MFHVGCARASFTLALLSSSRLHPRLDELPPDGVVVPAVVTHVDLANLCGGSRENITRILSEFQRRGLIEREGRRYALKNVEGLRRLASV